MSLTETETNTLTETETESVCSDFVHFDRYLISVIGDLPEATETERKSTGIYNILFGYI